MTKAPYMRARYERRKLAQVCTGCGGDIDTDTARCSSCIDEYKRIRKRYMANGGKAVANANKAQWRDLQRASGKCTMCAAPRVEGRKMCQRHLDKQSAANRLYRERRSKREAVTAAPVLSVVSVTRPAHQTIGRFAGMRPLDALHAKARSRVLGRQAIDTEAERRRVSVVFHELLAAHGVHVPAVNEPPPGWSVEEDIREEAIALGEHLALRRVA